MKRQTLNSAAPWENGDFKVTNWTFDAFLLVNITWFSAQAADWMRCWLSAHVNAGFRFSTFGLRK